MNSRTLKILVLTAALMPAFAASAIRLIVKNGDSEIATEVAAIYVPRNGVVVVVPDLIFRAPY